MYKVVVVDDEKIIRQGIKKLINNTSKKFDVIQDFSDGMDAIEFLKNNDADVVISDIKMIEMTGLDLANWICNNKPYIKTVLISGYKEFEYARQAIAYHVEHYLLKPINQSELLEILDSIGEKLKTQQRDKKQITPILSDDIILQQAKQFIEENYDKDISLTDVSDKVFFSAGYFSRFFKKETGENFSDYLLKLRMIKAVELLKENKKVEEVSRLCGYNSPAYFSHIFKDYYGYAPKDYIRRF